MMNLTQEQFDELRAGRAVRVPTPEIGADCVVLRADLFDRVQRVLAYDDSPWTEDEQRALLRSFGEKAGWDDPDLDVYEEYRRK
jgi:hypothetical protein